MTITEFILARIAEREEAARAAAEAARLAPSNDLSDHWVAEVIHSHDGKPFGLVSGAPIQATRPTAFARTVEHIAYHDPASVLAECEAKRRIVELHESWPVLVERQPTFETIEGDDPTRLAFRATREIAWLTEQEYRTRFGDEPPTAPMIRVLAAIWADHADYDPAWVIA